jgi:hypothetical protein
MLVYATKAPHNFISMEDNVLDNDDVDVVSLIAQIPAIQYSVSMPPEGFTSFGNIHLMRKFVDEVGHKDCMFRNSYSQGHGKSESYTFAYSKKLNQFIISFLSSNSSIDTMMCIDYTPNKNKILMYLDMCCYALENHCDTTDYQYVASQDMEESKVDEVSYAVGEYRDVISHIRSFYCHTCANNVGMVVKSREEGIPCLEIYISNKGYIRIMGTTECHQEINKRNLQQLKALGSSLPCMCQMRDSTLYDRLIISFVTPQYMRIQISSECTDGFEVGVIVSLIEYGNEVFSFINRWIEHIRNAIN